MKLCNKCGKRPRVKGKNNTLCQPCASEAERIRKGRSFEEMEKMAKMPIVTVYRPGDPGFDEISESVTHISKIKK